MAGILEQTYELKSGFAMPVLALGTWELRGDECVLTVQDAVELGYRHIDTAELYENEAEIGQALRDADRGQLFITSKVANSHLRREDLLKACEASLKRLGTEYIDLYLVHWPNDDVPIAETMKAMKELVEAGKVRSVGLSNFDVGRMQEAMSASDVAICNNQVEYHPYRPRREIPQFCHKRGISVTAYCPLARGEVLGDARLVKIGKKYDKSAVQVSLRWLLQKGVIIIPKASSREHLQENADMDGWELSADDMEAIDALGVEKKLVDSTYT
jgi:diketogulonate reductase-like aldo/keto reductase